MSGPYTCFTSVYIKSLFTAHAFAMVWRFIYAFYHSSLTSYGVNCLLIFHYLLACSFQRLGLCLIVGFPFLSPFFTPFVILSPFLPYHSAIPTMVLLDPCSQGLLWASCMFFSQLVSMTQYDHWIYTHTTLGFLDPLHCLWAPLAYFFLLGHPWPICIPWASSA